MVNLYELLGLPIDAAENQIRQHIMQHHAAGTLDDKVLEAAKKWLLNPDIRKQYDAKLLSATRAPKEKQKEIKVTPITNDKGHARQQFINNKRAEKNNSNKKIYAIAAVILMAIGAGYGAYSYKETKKQKAIEVAKQKEEKRINDLKEQAVKELKLTAEITLKDPSSVLFKDVIFGISDEGYPIVACGEYNAKNSYGAYTGFKLFSAPLAKGSGTGYIFEGDKKLCDDFIESGSVIEVGEVK